MGNQLEDYKMFLIGQALEKYCASSDPHDECLHYHDVNIRNSGDDVYDGYEKVIGFSNKSGDKFDLRCQGAIGKFSCDLFKLGTDAYDDTGVQVKIENRRNDPMWRYSTGRDAFIAQRAENGRNIEFPSYGVTSGSAKDPILITRGQQDCIVIVIHDKRRRFTLLVHLLTSSDELYNPHLPPDVPCLSGQAGYGANDIKEMDMQSMCSFRFHESEEYITFFKNEYFKDALSQDLEVTVINTLYTPADVTKKTLEAIQRDFEDPKIEHKDYGDISLGGDIPKFLMTMVDSRTGKVQTFLEFL